MKNRTEECNVCFERQPQPGFNSSELFFIFPTVSVDGFEFLQADPSALSDIITVFGNIKMSKAGKKDVKSWNSI